MRAVSRLASSMGARAWLVTGFTLLAVGALSILEDGPVLLPCLAVTFAGLAFRCAMFIHQQARTEPTRPWLQVERPTEE